MAVRRFTERTEPTNAKTKIGIRSRITQLGNSLKAKSGKSPSACASTASYHVAMDLRAARKAAHACSTMCDNNMPL
eukprot:5993032-Amphidinium_carterae.1